MCLSSQCAGPIGLSMHMFTHPVRVALLGNTAQQSAFIPQAFEFNQPGLSCRTQRALSSISAKVGRSCIRHVRRAYKAIVKPARAEEGEAGGSGSKPWLWPVLYRSLWEGAGAVPEYGKSQ